MGAQAAHTVSDWRDWFLVNLISGGLGMIGIGPRVVK
jgi:hypothetical protein